MKPGDIVLTSAPIAFTFGLGATLLFPLRFGAATATLEQASPPAMLDAIAKFGVTHLATAPTAYKAMLGQPELDRALPSLTACVSAGEHLPAVGVAGVEGPHRPCHRRRHRLDRDDAHLHFRQRRRHPPRQHRPGGPRLHRRDPRRRRQRTCRRRRPPRRSAARPAAATSTTRARPITSRGGWNITGDTYRRDADGYYWYLARSDDMIVSSGYNIGAPEVENALLAHPAVAECAVIGVRLSRARAEGQSLHRPRRFRDPERGTRLTGSRPSSRTASPPTNIPATSNSSTQLPKTATGKLRRVDLRNR